jgi:hypothetical protein
MTAKYATSCKKGVARWMDTLLPSELKFLELLPEAFSHTKCLRREPSLNLMKILLALPDKFSAKSLKISVLTSDSCYVSQGVRV